ncbi:MAG: hypothetical protein LBT89_11035 [Planctomycetaceae bacterium]|nr:hypothetical protein [Planctomycetaceae bacterium]
MRFNLGAFYHKTGGITTPLVNRKRLSFDFIIPLRYNETVFTFHWSELLVIAVGGILMLISVAVLMLRRRNEILQEYLTPEEPELEDSFFRTSNEPAETEEPEPETVGEESLSPEPEQPPEVQWGGEN